MKPDWKGLLRSRSPGNLPTLQPGQREQLSARERDPTSHPTPGKAAQIQKEPSETGALSEYDKLDGDDGTSHPWRWGKGPAAWGTKLTEEQNSCLPFPRNNSTRRVVNTKTAP